MQPLRKCFEYEINGTTYEQRKLVAGQVEQLGDLIVEAHLSFADPSIGTIVRTLGDHLYRAIAIVLRKKGAERWWEKDLDVMAGLLRWEMEAETAADIVKDFFDCNPLGSLLEKLSGLSDGLIGQWTAAMKTLKEKAGAIDSAASPQTATLQSGKQSSGDIPSTS
jgi:hypothetical protein